MTSEEIDRLARTYADETCPIADYGAFPELRESDTALCYEDMKRGLEWLSKSYCLVSQTSVIMEHARAHALLSDGIQSDTYEAIENAEGRIRALEAIVGKETLASLVKP